MYLITLYYCADEYQNGMGIGFYPTIKRYKKKNKIDIYFTLTKQNTWKQLTGPVIYGFIKVHGQELLDTLNNIGGDTVATATATTIYNSGGRQVFPITNITTYYILDNYHSTQKT